MLPQIVIDDIQDVFSVDALETSHPISVQVNDPEQINELFDRISYEKGNAHTLPITTYHKKLIEMTTNLTRQHLKKKYNHQYFFTVPISLCSFLKIECQ